MMNTDREEQIDRLFYALSDRTRRQMLMSLAQEELNISQLGDPLGMTKQAVSKHVKVLEQAGLITKHKDGRLQRCSFNADKLKVMQGILNQYKEFWEHQLDALEKYIEDVNRNKGEN